MTKEERMKDKLKKIIENIIIVFSIFLAFLIATEVGGLFLYLINKSIHFWQGVIK